MKFTDGNWMVQPGVSLHPAAEVHDVTMDSNSVTVYAPCKHINHRGATLDGPLLTVRYSSPAKNVIRVQVYHYKGGRKKTPEFELHTSNPCVVIKQDEETVSLTSGDLAVKVHTHGGWLVDFYQGDARLTRSGRRGLAYVKTDENKAYMREQLGLGVGECVYGLGERFTSFVKNGQTVDIWNRDGGTGTEQAYKNIPFYVTNKGYGVFVNHPELVSFEVGTEAVSKVQFSVEGEYLDYFVIGGPTVKAVLERYTTLTGKPALPPAWSFGLWLTTSFTTNYDEETVNHFVNGMAERSIPLRVFHFDCFWMKEFEWCNFEWDERVFPQPREMLARLHEKGLKLCVWINPYIAQKSPLFDEGAEQGFLLKRQNGEVWQWDMWQAGMGIVDFTNPAACEWYAGKLKALVDMGVDCFKTDFGERIPTDVVYFDGSDPQKMHNYYTHLYNKVVFDALKDKLGDGEAVLFARSATAGGQQFPVHWGGDCAATYESMAESLRGGLSLALSGFGFWSHDISGFEDSAPAHLYKRWVAFGLLSSHSRLHGNSSYRVPWLFDEESVDVLRHFTNLKHRLMPYLWRTANEATEHGVPMMRPMVMAFADDPTCHHLDRQYMLGESLLVAPIFNEDGIASYYLPKGTWTHFLSGKKVEGGSWREEHYDYFSLPLFVPANSVIAVGSEHGTPDYDYLYGVTLHVFELDSRSDVSVALHHVDGSLAAYARVSRSDDEIAVRVEGATKPWSVLLRGIARVKAVQNGSWVQEDLGVLVNAENAGSGVEIRL